MIKLNHSDKLTITKQQARDAFESSLHSNGVEMNLDIDFFSEALNNYADENTAAAFDILIDMLLDVGLTIEGYDD